MSGTLKFIIIFSFFTGSAIGFLFMCRKKTFISKTYYSEKWSEAKKKTINWIVRVMMGLFSVLLLVFITIPMSIDIPCLISGDYKTCKGVVTSYEYNTGYKGRNIFLSQDIMIDNNVLFTYYLAPAVQVGEIVTVVYLPNSRFVLEVVR